MNKEEDKAQLPGNRPTASDVARMAGVSRTQVSYVLNNNLLDHVSNEKRDRILKAAQDLGYQPHASAQALRRGYSKEFSIFFPAPYSPRINNIIGTIHETGLVNDFTPIQYSFNSYRDEKRMYESLHTMLNKKPYGVFCSLMDLEQKELDYILNKGVQKLLILDIEMHKDIPTLYLPIREVGQLAGKHLSSRGYENVVMLKPSDPVQQRAFWLRHNAFLDGWDKAKNLNMDILEWSPEVFRPSMESTRIFVENLLNLKRKPDALYAYSDDYALPVITILKEKGLKIPDDIAVMGTDDIQYSQMITPKLTTIKMDSLNLGLRAVALMNHLITGLPLEDHFKEPAIPIVIEREST